MFKFGLALGIAYEWAFGASVVSVQTLAYALGRSVCASLLAWLILEAWRVLYLGAMSLDDSPPAAPSRESRPR